jgi:hypothetical protein
MPAKDEEVGVVSSREDDVAEEFSFDSLPKGLANGTMSRRRTLKLVGAAILGGGVLTLLPGTAMGASGANCPSSGAGCDTACKGDLARRRGCICIRTAEQTRTCVRPCCSDRGCSSSNDCRSGEVCMRPECCGPVRGVCVPKCTADRPNYCDSSAAQSTTTWDANAA